MDWHRVVSQSVGKTLAQGMMERWRDGSVLQEAAESIWKGTCVLWQESELVKSRKMKWPLSAWAGGGANGVVSALETGCWSERVKQLSYCMPSSEGV